MKVCNTLGAMVAITLLGSGSVPGHPTAIAEAREVVARSLPFLAEEGTDWIEERKCASCHHTSFLVWSHQLADGAGFDVDRAQLREWTDWALQKQLSEHEKGGLVGERNIEGLSQFLLGTIPREGEVQRAALAKFPALIASKQEVGGSWAAGGQLPTQKRPKAETAEVSTMWALLALGKAGQGDPAVEAARKRAAAVLAGSQLTGKSTEWHVMRLLVDRREGREKETRRRTEALLALQNEDGGWSWRTGDASDALATGQALWGLSEAGVPHRHDAIRRAWSFLARTQDEDGAWPVRSTKASEQEEELPTSVFWGSAWAVIGILETLPPPEEQ